MGFQVICINAKNKPAEYPIEDKWLTERDIYTPIKVAYLIDGNIGVLIEEITPSEDNPFQYFNIDRFGVPLEHIEEFNAWVKDQLENQEDTSPEIDFEKLIKEEELV